MDTHPKKKKKKTSKNVSGQALRWISQEEKTQGGGHVKRGKGMRKTVE